MINPDEATAPSDGPTEVKGASAASDLSPSVSSVAVVSPSQPPVYRPRFVGILLLSRRLRLAYLWYATGFVALIAISVVALVTATDWGDAATRIGILVGVAALLAGTVLAVRSLADPRRADHRWQLVFAVLICVALVAGPVGGFALAAPLRSAQARAFESQHAWQRAIDEYKRAGAIAPSSTDLARVYNEWGEALLTDGNYAQAVEEFGVVVQEYSAVGSQVERAKHDMVTAYLSWARAALAKQDYTDAKMAIDALLNLSYCDAVCQGGAAPLAVSAYLEQAESAIQAGNFAAAIEVLDTLLTLPICDSTCQDTAKAQDATAYYKQAESDLAAGAAADAVTEFRAILARFPQSPEATLLHPDLAKALLQVGMQQLKASCSSAIPTYQDLAANFADTPEGQQAAAALAQGQPVTGNFTKTVPVGAAVELTWGLHAGISQNDFNIAWSNGYSFRLWIFQAPSGYFRFASVPPGTYDLLWWTSSGGLIGMEFATNPDGSPTYVAHVQPLCPLDFGNISEDFPTP